MNITSAQYTTEEKKMIKATIDGKEMFVPTDTANRRRNIKTSRRKKAYYQGR